MVYARVSELVSKRGPAGRSPVLAAGRRHDRCAAIRPGGSHCGAANEAGSEEHRGPAKSGTVMYNGLLLLLAHRRQTPGHRGGMPTNQVNCYVNPTPLDWV